VIRPVLVFDGDGTLIATFADASAAHAWAHSRAAEPATRLPVQVDDCAGRTTRTVEPGRCRLHLWQVAAGQVACATPAPATPTPVDGPAWRVRR
jgi:hypothetical protein